LKIKQSTKKQKLIVIVGPTASGKTEYAVEIAKKFNGEIVSADSRQIYKGMNLGTAKPNGKWINGKFIYKGIPHHLIDFLEPSCNFTVAQYKNLAIKKIKEIAKRKKIAVLIGGTGLYIKAVVDNLDIPEIPPQPNLRAKLEKKLKQKGIDYLFNKLISLDPEAAYIIDPKNPRRVIRALEIILVTNKPFSSQRKSGRQLFDALEIGIAIPKEKLFTRIDKRIDVMMQKGLLKEVKMLIQTYGEKRQAFDAIGYRELIPYIRSQKNIGLGLELMKKNTRNYAKRQLTWFKKDKRINWVNSVSKAKTLVRAFLQK